MSSSATNASSSASSQSARSVHDVVIEFHEVRGVRPPEAARVTVLADVRLMQDDVNACVVEGAEILACAIR